MFPWCADQSFFHSSDNLLELQVFFHVLFLLIHLFKVILVSLLTFGLLFSLWNNISICSALHKLFAAPEPLHWKDLLQRLICRWSHVWVQANHFSVILLAILVENGDIVLSNFLYPGFMLSLCYFFLVSGDLS